ncbi:MAG TPA: MFS transporter [candidate division Zixibacteria bacterium]|nr:MFS transporter [candidate division Zixibacteria bacterium]MDD4917343.1 MFS transporter [candidate division Zixibacteria bacterium]MDM7971901.1 MFS transporter [candidate division Zixibacteria bacterium]HOD66954.1 MFS transporter [candidate division Zixibacteria bacterium]HQL23927.1 MFS transporter [candidate division Zixibacteria bacterium]
MTSTAPAAGAAGGAANPGLFRQLASLPRPFWMANVIEMFERLAYYGVRVVIPIYIAQADEPGGLHFTQADKGLIFMIWAIVQSLVPMVSGGFADRYGYKKTMAFAFTVKIIGYLTMATQREFWPFLGGVCLLAFGTAVFKPGVQGTLVRTLNNKNSSIGWGTFYMLVNIGGFLGPPLAHFFYGISWPAVFFGCAGIISLNYIMLFTYKEVHAGGEQKGGPLHILAITARNFLNGKLVVFILIMSGFWLMFMQLFDMLPNFIVDWVNSASLVKTLGLPDWMLQLNSDRAPQLSQEWMINANSGLIILLVVPLSWMVSRLRRVHSITIGVIISSVGLVLAGFTTAGVFCILGIMVFSVGEMLASPKMNEYLGVIAPEGQKGLYMGYANVPLAVGWGYGSLYGGQVYGTMGEKAKLAADYLAAKYQVLDVARTEAFAKLQEVSGMNAQEATDALWHAYHPYKLWYQFAAVGLLSAAAMVWYSWWVKRDEKANA